MQKNLIKILFIGDIVGRPGRNTVRTILPKLKEEEGIDFVIANGENLAAGKGMTKDKYDEMIAAGIDYFTSGNHIWQNRDIIPYLKDKSINVLRPANYAGDTPGKGFDTVEIKGTKLTIVNLLGRVFIKELLDDPFEVGLNIAEKNKDSIIIVDIHAEATSEKMALGYYLDGKVSAVIGTHTHIQTADEKILENGTAYLTDAGMCGPENSVLGVEKDIVIAGFLTGLPQSFKVAGGECIFNACIIEIDISSKKAKSIRRIFERVKL